MSKHKAFFVFLAFFVWLAFPVGAQQRDAGTSGAQFLKIGVGNPKALALGRAYTALAEGVESLGFNPAGLARSNSREVSFAMTSWIESVRGHYLAYSHPFLRSNVGFSASYFTLDDFDTRDENGIPVVGANVFVRMGYANGAFAWSLPAERIFIGAGMKAVMEDYSENAQVNFVTDTGVIWRPDGPFQFGVTLLNLGFDAKKVPWSLRTGAAYAFPAYATVSMDLIQDRDAALRLGTGLNIDIAESREIGLISLRFGFYSADDQGESTAGFLKSLNLHRTSGLCYGLGVQSLSESLKNFSFDYALLPLGALDTTHHIAVKFSF